MKILITSYYELRESLLCASKSLQKLGINVISYPLYKNYFDHNEKLSNCCEHFVEFIQSEKPDVILWWYINILSEDMDYIVRHNPLVKNIFFNWDEPYNWEPWDIKNKAKFFDCVFVCCEETLTNYLENGSKNAVYCLPGYDPKVHNIIVDENDNDMQKYSCDISFCCTNLYEGFENQYVPRKELVDTIYNNQEKYDYTFHLYGPESFREKYPKSYKGYINYFDTPKLFNYSKINLCTHVQCHKNKYLNERTILVLGSGGLLFVDDVKGIDEVLDIDKECVVIDKDNYLEQIVDILKNYDEYCMRRYDGHVKSKEYTWDKWAKLIYDEYLKKIEI